MTQTQERPNVPAAIRPVFDEIVDIADGFCAVHLDAEYARLCLKMAAKLARKRPSPLARGDRAIWAAAIIYAVGRVNFLGDPSRKPCITNDRIAQLLGVKQNTMATKGRLIMDMLNVGLMDPEYTRTDRIADNPMAWFVKIDGIVMDARALPEPIQVALWQRGVIPFVPARR